MVKRKNTAAFAPRPFDSSKAASNGPVPLVPIRRVPEKRVNP
jgi:hypothetical protein